MKLTMKFAFCLIFIYNVQLLGQSAGASCFGFKDDRAVCPANVDPVCGCDGVTYVNDCTAKKSGILRTSPGPCPNNSSTDGAPVSGDPCFTNKLTERCASVLQPVCGCDGITYNNECEAKNAGIKVTVQGPCRTGNNNGGGAVTDNCVGQRINKTCTSVPDNVCGCDGVTYINPCSAEVAGVKLFTKGPCKNGNNGSVVDGKDCKGPRINKTCTSVPDNVCGCDGVTYSNPCAAEVAGIKSFTKGPCKQAGGNHGGNSGWNGWSNNNNGWKNGNSGWSGRIPESKGKNKVNSLTPSGKIDKSLTGCEAIYDHITNWVGSNGELGATQIVMGFYKDDGIDTKVTDNPTKTGDIEVEISKDANGKEIDAFIPGIGESDVNNVKEGFINIPLSKLSRNNPALANALDGNLNGNNFRMDSNTEVLTVSNPKGRDLYFFQMDKPNKNGIIWGRGTINGKSYLVRVDWVRGQRNNRGVFETVN